jgi:mannan endo-1,4-beta-mannosidase
MAYEDGIRGLSSQRLSKGPAAPVLEAWMRRHYDEGLVLMDDYRTPISPVQSGVPMDRFIGVGNKPYWSDSLNNPGKYATWIVLQQAETDAVWSGFSRTSQRILEDHFVEVYRAGTRHVYKRRPAAPGVVQKRGQHLVVDDRRWNPVGANSYDLLEQPQAVIDARLEAMAGRGLNSVRTWCFDNDGGLREETLSKLSSTLLSAQEVGIKVVCTLANNLSDFGGPQYFTPPGEDFYTSELARSRYLRQVQRLLEYKDANGRRLADSPAILAWDLINEPRPSVASSSSAVRDWAEAAAHFVGGIDQLHLITIGAEGFSTGYPVDQRLAASPPIDFAEVCGVPGITLCQAHLFAKYLNHPYSSRELGQIMQAWRTSADAINKPLMMGEVGYSLSDGSNSEARRVVFLDNVARAITNSDIDGAMIWNLGAEADRQFTISLDDPMSRRLIGSWATKILRLPVPSRAPGDASSSLPRTKQWTPGTSTHRTGSWKQSGTEPIPAG